MPRLTHFDAEGKAAMVDVSAKAETERSATAKGSVLMQPATLARTLRISPGLTRATIRLGLPVQPLMVVPRSGWMRRANICKRFLLFRLNIGAVPFVRTVPTQTELIGALVPALLDKTMPSNTASLTQAPSKSGRRTEVPSTRLILFQTIPGIISRRSLTGLL
jgi:hypothetical protein